MEKRIEKACKKALKKKIKDGTIERLIDDQLNRAIAEAIVELVRLPIPNGSAHKQMQARIDSSVSNAAERSDHGDMTVMVTAKNDNAPQCAEGTPSPMQFDS